MAGKELDRMIAWNRIVKRRLNAKTFIDKYLPKGEHPLIVRSTVAALMTLCQLKLEARGIMKGTEDIAFCDMVDGHCDNCKIVNKKGLCLFPDNRAETIDKAERLYSKLYKKMPEEYKC